KEGIGLIPLEAGAELVVQELARPAGDVEVLVLGSRESTVESREPEKTNGFASPPTFNPQPSTLSTPLSLAFERELSVTGCPVLSSHVLGGKAVLPVALTVEWLAHAALHRNPGLEFVGFDGLQVFKGVRLEAGESRTLQVLAGKPQRSGTQFLAEVQLVSPDHDRPVIHAAAKIVLGNTRDAATEQLPMPAGSPWTGDIYRRLFHGPALHAIERVESCGPEGIVVFSRTAPSPAEWM